ncbi:S-adenosyl-L-methionine-dependent methyltransferase [Geranomyces variabilis]|nr:S-adenosyl-L-methionine-dependent methyltransferase [Geranomyces variabilis]KAJ3139865.1 Alkylated DNA repair protein alkB 8 [Geranomyces variabilis]
MDSLPKEELEHVHVHNVYNIIAPHFSATRYKPWPIVDNFLRGLNKGSIGADVGCGNGKYLGVNPDVFTVGSDRSDKLIDIVRERGFEAMVCDNLRLPYRDSCFVMTTSSFDWRYKLQLTDLTRILQDFITSIAVIHHMSSPERRLMAVNELIRVLKPGGRVLIFVWAFEQESRSKRRFSEQDVFVPWKMPKAIYGPASPQLNTAVAEDGGDVVYQRYYHLFKEKELEQLVRQAPDAVVEACGYDRDNWYVIASKKVL